MSGLLKGALLYVAIVFSAGFVLGTLRVLIVVPRLGARAAELIELPLMLTVAIISAKWIARRPWVGSPAGRLAMGSAALALLLAVELSLVLSLRGLTIREYIATQDPVSGTAYYLALALFGVIPLLVGGQSIASTRRKRLTGINRIKDKVEIRRRR